MAPPTTSAAIKSANGDFSSVRVSRDARLGKVVMANFVAPPEMMNIAITDA